MIYRTFEVEKWTFYLYYCIRRLSHEISFPSNLLYYYVYIIFCLTVMFDVYKMKVIKVIIVVVVKYNIISVK